MSNASNPLSSEAHARHSILELISAYGLLFDAGFGKHADPDWAAKFGQIWASHAMFTTYPNLVVSEVKPINGRDNIVAEFLRILKEYPHPYFVRHLTTNPVIDSLDAASGVARARSALIAVGISDFSDLKVHRSGVYFDSFCVEDGRWRIKRRDLVYDGPGGPGAPAPVGWFRAP